MTEPAPPEIVRRRRIAIVLILLIGTLNFVDPVSLGIANPLIRADLGLSVSEMGVLLSVFLWSFAVFQLPSGAVVDRFGPRRALGASIVVWSVIQAGCALAGGFWPFAAIRGALGAAEGPLFPAMVRLIRDWYAPHERGLPNGIGFAASKLGPTVAPILLTPLMLWFGWQWMFVVTGVAGMCSAVLWNLAYRDPAEARLSPDGRAWLARNTGGAEAAAVTWADWRALLGYRATWGMFIGLFGEVYMGWVYQTWLPGYLVMERHMSLPTTGLVAGIPFAFGVLGSVGSGWVTDRLTGWGLSAVNGCKVPVVVGLVGMAGFTAVAALTPSTFVAVAAIAVALLFNGMAGAMCCTMAGVMAPRQCAASLHGIQTFGGFIGGGLAPAITGFIVQYGGGFPAALLFSAAVGIAAAAVYVVMVPNRPMMAETEMAGGAWAKAAGDAH